VISITLNESTCPMVLATAPCWVQPSSSKKISKNIFRAAAILTAILTGKVLLTPLKKMTHTSKFLSSRDFHY
jgi:hypothetical protein